MLSSHRATHGCNHESLIGVNTLRRDELASNSCTRFRSEMIRNMEKNCMLFYSLISNIIFTRLICLTVGNP